MKKKKKKKTVAFDISPCFHNIYFSYTHPLYFPSYICVKNENVLLDRVSWRWKPQETKYVYFKKIISNSQGDRIWNLPEMRDKCLYFYYYEKWSVLEATLTLNSKK